MPDRFRHTQHDESEIEGQEFNPYVPLRLGPSIPHYYGDYVRQIFLVCGGVMLLVSPFVGSTLPGVLPFEIGGAIIFVVLGALTNARSQLSSVANIVAAGVGAIAYELLALSLLSAGAYFAFIEREALAIALLLALYFSLKTLRNKLSGKIGKRSTAGEFFKRPGGRNMMSPGDGD